MLVATEPKLKMDGSWVVVDTYKFYKNVINEKKQNKINKKKPRLGVSPGVSQGCHGGCHRHRQVLDFHQISSNFIKFYNISSFFIIFDQFSSNFIKFRRLGAV